MVYFCMKIRIFVTIAILGLIFASCNRTNNEEHIAEQIEESKSVYQTGYTLMIERQYEKAQKILDAYKYTYHQ